MNDMNSDIKEKRRRLADLSPHTGPEQPRIIIAEDDVEMAVLLVRAFTRAGYRAFACHTGWDLLKLLGVFPVADPYKGISLVVSDIRLPGISGLDALKICGYVGKFPPVILMTAFGDNWTRTEALKLGAVDMLDKPFDIDELVEKIRELIPPPA